MRVPDSPVRTRSWKLRRIKKIISKWTIPLNWWGLKMRHAPVHVPASPLPNYIVYYICFFFINPVNLLMKTLTKMSIQFIQNKIYLKQNFISGHNYDW